MNYKEKDVKNAMRHDKIAFESLYRDINTDLCKMALYMLGNNQIAEEIVSETVLDALIGITKLKDETRFEAMNSRSGKVALTCGIAHSQNSSGTINTMSHRNASIPLAAQYLSMCSILNQVGGIGEKWRLPSP